MNKTTTNKHNDLLPEDTHKALQVLIRYSERLHDITEKQTQALVQNDILGFAVLVQEQEVVSTDYAQACTEFRARLDEFRKADKTLISKLEVLQKQIGEKARSNNIIVEKMQDRSAKKAQSSLISVQELAKQKPLKFAEDDAANGQGE